MATLTNQYDNNNSYNNKKTKVQISVYASKLKNVAGAFKGTSDPYAVVTVLAGSPHEKPDILGKTEVIKNTLDPAWVTTFETTYTFGQETKFNVSIFDEVRKTGKSKSMGSALFEMGNVMGSRGNIKAKKLKSGGTVYVRVTKAATINYGTLHLQLQGIKLKNVDGMFSKSDPFFIIQALNNDAGGNVWQPVYRSEYIKNDLYPKWKEFTIPMEKLCGGDKEQGIQIEVWDWEKSGKHHPMGKFQVTAASILRNVVLNTTEDPKKMPKENAFKVVHKGKSYGNIVITKAYITGEDLTAPKPQTVGAILNPGQTPASAHSPGSPAPKKFIKINGISKINPEWKAWKAAQETAPAATPAPASTTPSNIPAAAAPSQQPADPAPSFSNALGAAPPTQPFPPPMAPPAAAAAMAPPAPANYNNNYNNTKPTFVDYISGGTDISLVVAIDFTGSNGDPRKPGTLHYIHRDGQLNDYEKALTAVGSIVARYDSDQIFPVLGFGAKYGGVIQHCFQVGNAPELKGVNGMLEGYRSVFKTALTMSGPTVFAEVIRYAASQAQQQQQQQQSYTILLILTDGAVTDVEQTKQAIREASIAPLSIVIVGIGNADFSAMQFLDDFQRAEAGGARDIVQFVEFSKHRQSRAALTRETLDEIPDQLVDYFYKRGIMPLTPTGGSTLNIMEEEYNEEEDIDLAIDINEDGDITLPNNSLGATWDGQSYGTASMYLPPAMAPPPSSAAAYGAPGHVTPYQPATAAAAPTYGYAPQGSYGASHGAYASAGGNSYTSYAPAGGNGVVPQGSYVSSAPTDFSSSYGAPYAQSGVAAAAAGGTRLPIHHGATPTAPVVATPSVTMNIRAPPGTHPGMQLQVQDPTTGQMRVVTIPNGVQPGGTFAVQL